MEVNLKKKRQCRLNNSKVARDMGVWIGVKFKEKVKKS
jgi:hypothetical protein